MHHTNLTSFAAAALLSLLTVEAAAQTQVLASFPLADSLDDVTNNHGPVVLYGSTTGPADGVCVGGTYSAPNVGDELYSPLIGGLDDTDFQIDVDFNLTSFTGGSFGPRVPIVVGGRGWRWIGIEVNRSTGEVGVLFNNSSFVGSGTTVNLGEWYWATLKYDNGSLELLLDGASVLSTTIAALSTNNDHRFTTTNYGFGASLSGCVRNLVIANDATVGSASASAANYGTGCGGLSLAASGAPVLGNVAFSFDITAPQPLLSFAFLAVGSAAVDPGIDLTAAGFPGCLGYTNPDIGVFGAVTLSPTTGSGSFFAPIVPSPSIAGALVAAQAIGFDPAQPVTSNGTRVYVGM